MHARTLHPTLVNLAALRQLRRGHRVMGPNLGKWTGHVAGLVGLDAVTGMTSKVLGSVAGMVGFDFGSAQGLGGGGVVNSGGGGGGIVPNPTFTTQAQKDAAMADAKAQIAGQQAKIANEVSVRDGFQGIVDANGGPPDPDNEKPTDGMVQNFLDQIGTLNFQIVADKASLAGLQQNLSILQSTPVTPQGGGGVTPQPQPMPQPTPQVQPAPQASAGMPLWKKILLGVAVAGAGFVAYENA